MEQDAFTSAEGCHATSLHEHVHWTGHTSRESRRRRWPLRFSMRACPKNDTFAAWPFALLMSFASGSVFDAHWSKRTCSGEATEPQDGRLRDPAGQRGRLLHPRRHL